MTQLLEHETAGDPMTDLKWTRKSTYSVARTLRKAGMPISSGTVGRILDDLGFSLKVNRKTLESGLRNPPPRRVRNRQFRYIGQMRERFAAEGNPILSVDTKKKEPIGNFRNAGRTWELEPTPVFDHDFRCDAEAICAPRGLYDTIRNLGYMFLGFSYETPRFSVDCLVQWWRWYGRELYDGVKELLILADCGSANGPRSRVWKYLLQKEFCNPYGLDVTVCHYPPGASKYNPIEHLLFSFISLNWQGVPLQNMETVLNYIRRTRTETGLRVMARLMPGVYPKGESIPDRDMRTLAIEPHKTLPEWNYTIHPGKM